MRHDDSFWIRVESDVSRWGVKEACARHGVHRSAWYRRARRGGIEPVDRDGRDRAILDIARDRPAWGCDRIAYFLALEGMPVSSPTVQKVLVSAGLGRRAQREARIAGG